MTHTEILDKLGTAVKKGLGIDETVLESLEEALLEADVGAETAAALTDAVRGRVDGATRKDLEGLRRLLIEEIERMLAPSSAPAGSPRAAAARGALSRRRQRLGQDDHDRQARAPRPRRTGGASCSPPPTRFGRARSSSSKSGGSASACPSSGTRRAPTRPPCSSTRLSAAKARGAQLLLVDTAGRLHTKKNLMEELAKMRRIAAREVPGAPHQTLLVLDATTGGNGLAQARKFVDAAGVTGVVLTKLDGSARGGHRAGDLPRAAAARPLRRRRGGNGRPRAV